MPSIHFKPGNKLSPGRTPGSINKSTKKIRDAISLIVTDNVDQLREDLKAMKPKDRVQALTKLMEFILPKNVKVDMEVGNVYRMIWGEDPGEDKTIDADHKEVK